MRNRFIRLLPPRHFHRVIDDFRLFMEGEGGGGGGGSTQTPPRENPADVATRYSGDAVRMASKISDLEHDNFKNREKIRNFELEVTSLKGKVPVEGSVILTAEQAKAWESYQALGKPEELTSELESGKVAKTKVAESEKATTLEKAAKVAGMKPGLLKVLGKDLAVDVREVDVTDSEGKTSKAERAFVVSQNGKQEVLTPLADHFKSQGEDVFQSLQDTGAGGNGIGSGGQQQNPAQTQQQAGGATNGSGGAWIAQGAANAQVNNQQQAPVKPATYSM